MNPARLDNLIIKTLQRYSDTVFTCAELQAHVGWDIATGRIRARCRSLERRGKIESCPKQGIRLAEEIGFIALQNPGCRCSICGVEPAEERILDGVEAMICEGCMEQQQDLWADEFHS